MLSWGAHDKLRHPSVGMGVTVWPQKWSDRRCNSSASTPRSLAPAKEAFGPLDLEELGEWAYSVADDSPMADPDSSGVPTAKEVPSACQPAYAESRQELSDSASLTDCQAAIENEPGVVKVSLVCLACQPTAAT